jgi:hypothetical protein
VCVWVWVCVCVCVASSGFTFDFCVHDAETMFNFANLGVQERGEESLQHNTHTSMSRRPAEQENL